MNINIKSNFVVTINRNFNLEPKNSVLFNVNVNCSDQLFCSVITSY